MKQEAVRSLVEKTHDPDPRRRRRAVRELCPCGLCGNHEAAWARIFELVADPEAQVRRTVFHTLIDGAPRVRDAEVVAALESMRDDADRRLRRNVRKRLAIYRRTGRIAHA